MDGPWVECAKGRLILAAVWAKLGMVGRPFGRQNPLGVPAEIAKGGLGNECVDSAFSEKLEK